MWLRGQGRCEDAAGAGARAVELRDRSRGIGRGDGAAQAVGEVVRGRGRADARCPEFERSRGQGLGWRYARPVARCASLCGLRVCCVGREEVVCAAGAGGGRRDGVEGHEVLGGLCEGLSALELGDVCGEVGVDGAIWGDGGVEVDGGEEGGEVGGLGVREEAHGKRFP